MLFLFTACSVQLGTKRNYKAVEEKLLGFVLVYKLACTELHGSDSFVKCDLPPKRAGCSKCKISPQLQQTPTPTG